MGSSLSQSSESLPLSSTMYSSLLLSSICQSFSSDSSISSKSSLNYFVLYVCIRTSFSSWNSFLNPIYSPSELYCEPSYGSLSSVSSSSLAAYICMVVLFLSLLFLGQFLSFTMCSVWPHLKHTAFFSVSLFLELIVSFLSFQCVFTLVWIPFWFPFYFLCQHFSLVYTVTSKSGPMFCTF